MYALQSDKDSQQRARWLSGGALFTLGVLVLAANLLPEALPRRPAHKSLALSLDVIAQPPPTPKPPPPPDEEPAAPLQVPTAPQPAAAARRLIPPKPLPPMPAPANEPAAEDAAPPPPMRLGLTLSSLATRATQGVAFAVGSPQGHANGSPHSTRSARDTDTVGRPRHELAGSRGHSKEQTAAVLQQSVPPSYPPKARRAGIEGVVVLAITINAAGHVEAASVLRGLGYGLDESAIDAARHTVWKPAALGGIAIRTTRRFSVRFRLEG